MEEYNDSTLTISVLTNEIKKLRMTEDMKRREHANLQDGLQDTWDKLVNLRSHISLFKSSIEEVRVEEAAYMAHAFAESNEGKTSELTSEMATRLGSLHALREKVRLKEALKSKIAMMEEQLDSLRTKLSQDMEELSRNGQSSTINASSSTASTPKRSGSRGRATSPTPFQQVLARTEEHRVEDAMSVRSAVLETSRQLEGLEKSYVQSVSELEFVELEINQVLQWNPEYADGSAEEGKEPPSGYSLDESSSGPGATTGSTGASYCPVSLHEILSGQAHILRINGEAPTKYRHRLEKRLAALLVLDDQLQKELDVKNGVVNKVRSVLKDIEIQRLRKEVELNNLQQQLHNSFGGGALMLYNQTTQQTTHTTTIDNSGDDKQGVAEGLLLKDLDESSSSALNNSGFGLESEAERFPGSMMKPSRPGQEDDLPLHALSGIKPSQHNESLMSPGTPIVTHSQTEDRSERRTKTHTVTTHSKTETRTRTSTSGADDGGSDAKPGPYAGKGPRKPLGHINDPVHSQMHSSLPSGLNESPHYSHIGAEPVYPYGASGGKRNTKGQVESMLQRLENLAKQMEEKIDLTTGHKELVNTVSRQQEDLDSLRVTQANLVKLLNSESALDSEKNQEALRNLEYNVHDVAARHQELRQLREHLDDPHYVHPHRPDSEQLHMSDDQDGEGGSHVRLLSAHSDDAETEAGAARTKGRASPTNIHGSSHDHSHSHSHDHGYGRHLSPGHRQHPPSNPHKDDPPNTFGHGHGFDPLIPHPEHHIHGHEFDRKHHELKPTHGASLDSNSVTVLQYDEHYQNLLKKCDTYREKYGDALNTEYIDRRTDTSIDPHSRLSTATLDVKVKSARNLPITKRVTNSCDPFIELFLVSTSAAPNPRPATQSAPPVSADAEGADTAAAAAPTTEGEAGATGSPAEGTAATATDHDAGVDTDSPGGGVPTVNVFNKQSFSTHVVHNDMRPRWEEAFKFRELFNNHVDSSPTTALSHLSHPENHAIVDMSKSLSVFLLLMDHNRTAVADIIGECSISLSDFIDQEKHVIWAPIKPPVMEVVRSRPKLPKECAVKLEIRLCYNKQKLWKQRFNNANRDIARYIEQFHQQQALNQERDANYRKRKQEEASLSRLNKSSSDTEGDEKIQQTRRRGFKTPSKGQGPRPKTSGSGIKFSYKRMMELASRGQPSKPTSPQGAKKPPSPQRAATTPIIKRTTTPPRSTGASGVKANTMSNSGIKLTLQYRIGGSNSKTSIQTPFAGRSVGDGSVDSLAGSGDMLQLADLQAAEAAGGGQNGSGSGGERDRKASPKAAYVSMPITAATREELGLSNNVAVPFAKPSLRVSTTRRPSIGSGSGPDTDDSSGPGSFGSTGTTFVRSPNLRTVTHSVDGQHHAPPGDFQSPKKKAYDKKAFLASLISSRNGKAQQNRRREERSGSMSSDLEESNTHSEGEAELSAEDLEMY